jgi:multiple sugar transport system permease protein
MAFQDYKIVGKSPFVGLDNFISIALDPNFYHYILTTFRFVLWNLALAFFTPIFLAVLLTEVPRLKVFFRTLFFLPQMTSGLVVTLMWKEMFAGTASGTINRLLGTLASWFHLSYTPVDWLGNPATVMACVIIPGVWASAGISSLIYLAALKSVPEELYEAASIDGAGIFRKAIHITLPTILPLILINFVGAFIATFQSMASIFLLTFGGPGKATMVMGMAIWQEAYVNLRFSLATSYAWILGTILIGFTYLQLRILRRVDFRRAGGD